MNIECLNLLINILYKQPATSGTSFWNYITEAFEKIKVPGNTNIDRRFSQPMRNILSVSEVVSGAIFFFIFLCISDDL